jgi:hypothetical protein
MALVRFAGAALTLAAACVPAAELDELGKQCNDQRTCSAAYRCVMGHCALAPTHVLPPSLTTNPSFEGGLSGWHAFQSTVEAVMLADAPAGSWVTKVTWESGVYYSIDDAPQTVPQPTIGATYYAAACIAAASASAHGKRAEVILRAFDASSTVLLKGESPDVLLTDAFQLAQSQLTVPAGTDNVDVYVIQFDAQATDAFYADAVVVSQSPLGDLTCAPGATR